MKIWERYGIFFLFLVILGAFALMIPRIVSPNNLLNILVQSSIVSIAAAGMTLAITSGGFDLSVGAIYALVSCVLGKVIPVVGLTLGVFTALMVSMICGVFNGLIITKLRVQTFVATLATMIIFRGVAFIYTGGRDVELYGLPAIKVFTTGRFLGLPVPLLMTLIVFALVYFLYRHTPLGLHIRAIGSNEPAAVTSGIRVDRIKIAVFVFTAITACFSGLIGTAQLLTGNGRLGTDLALQAIAAVILGGTSLAGGRGRLLGTLVASILLATIGNGLNLLGVSAAYQDLSTGIILIVALAVEGLRQILGRRESFSAKAVAGIKSQEASDAQ